MVDLQLIQKIETADIKRFCKKFKTVFLYGTGSRSDEVADYLALCGIQINKRRVVSDEYYNHQENEIRLCEMPVNDVGLIIAVRPCNYQEVLWNAFCHGFTYESIFMIKEERRIEFIQKEKNLKEKKSDKSVRAIENKEWQAFYSYVEERCCPGKYNMMLLHNLGDHVIILSLIQQFASKIGGNFHFLIEKRMESLMELFCIDNYSVIDFKDIENYVGVSAINKHDMRELLVNMFPTVPQLNRPFFSRINNWDQMTKRWYGIVEAHAFLLGLKETRISPMSDYPRISDELKKKIEKIAPISKIVIFAPEAQTSKALPKAFWISLRDKIENAGYTIVTNAYLSSENWIEGTQFLDLSIEELVALANECHAIHSVRSGLCDLLAGLGNKLNVYYHPEMKFMYHSINYNFILREAVQEYIYFENEAILVS